MKEALTFVDFVLLMAIPDVNELSGATLFCMNE